MSAFQIKRPLTAFSLDPSDKDQKRITDEPHLDFIRKLPSLISGREPCEACHLRAGNPLYRKKRTGGAQRPDDAWALPMTAVEHKAQHGMNEIAFWESHGVTDPFAIALALYQVSGDLKAGRRIIRDSIRKRRAGI